MSYVLEVKNLSCGYYVSKQGLRGLIPHFASEIYWVFRELNFGVNENTITAVVGQNASGKTTLLRALPLKWPYGMKVVGDIYYSKNYRSKIGFLSEDNPNLREKIEEIAMERQKEAEKAIELGAAKNQVAIEELKRMRAGIPLTGYLSGGERQMLYLDTMLEMDHPILLLDEPFQSLDRYMLQESKKKIKERKDEGATIILATNHLDQAIELPDKVLYLGTMHRFGTVEELLQFEDVRVLIEPSRVKI